MAPARVLAFREADWPARDGRDAWRLWADARRAYVAAHGGPALGVDGIAEELMYVHEVRRGVRGGPRSLCPAQHALARDLLSLPTDPAPLRAAPGLTERTPPP